MTIHIPVWEYVWRGGGCGLGVEKIDWRLQAENPRHLGFPWQPDMLHKSLKEGHTKQFELIFILR